MIDNRNEPLYVTKSYLPPLDEYIKYLEGIWSRNQLTNDGPLVKGLELKLKEYLGVKHCFYVSNGTIALQIAIKALDLKGEIITTPFSFVATTSSIVWEGCKPVFVDIDEDTLNIDPYLIEAAISENTTAILATHVYGNPCNVEKIDEIAKKHNLKVIYDAAHAFAVTYNGASVLNKGDISTISFHATKLFHTVEGGAIITNDDDLAHRIMYMRNFGIKNQLDFWGLGINAKNSEFHAAMGHAVFPYIESIIDARRNISNSYDALLKKLEFTKPKIKANIERNYAYYPIILQSEAILVKVVQALKENNIYPRRYFHPLLDELPYIRSNIELPISRNIAKRVLCLPLSFGLGEEDLLRIVGVIKKIYRVYSLEDIN